MSLENSSQADPDISARDEVITQLRQGRPLGEVAREYGLLVADLCRWIAETVTAFESVTLGTTEENDEIRRLRLENEYLRKQRDFYRKAAGIVAETSAVPGASDRRSRARA
jgi:hypothetical protein